jgi:cell division protein ZapA (FtsZ GTPase activity inhibitor)
MDEFTITVKIANRSYRLKIQREEEEEIRNAVEQINSSIKAYAENIAYKDEQDLVALVALEEKISNINCRKEKKELEEEIDTQFIETTQLLSKYK